MAWAIEGTTKIQNLFETKHLGYSKVIVGLQSALGWVCYCIWPKCYYHNQLEG